MSGIYTRINKLLEYVAPTYASNAFDLWAELAHPNNKVLPLEHLSDARFSIDETKKTFVYSGTHNIFNKVSEEDRITREFLLTEDLAEKVYEAIQRVALQKIESDYKEEETRLRTLKKKAFLNKKIFGQSFDFITEE